MPDRSSKKSLSIEVRKFLRRQGRRLSDHYRHRLEVHAHAISHYLPPELQLQELNELLIQFADEEKYLTPELRMQFESLSENSRRNFVRELKRLAEMNPSEREIYLASNETFRHFESGECSPLLKQALQVLGLSYPCSINEIKQAYRLLAKTTHPDRGGQTEGFLHLQRAYLTALKNIL